MLYPKAIDDDDELPSETDSSSDEEIEVWLKIIWVLIILLCFRQPRRERKRRE